MSGQSLLQLPAGWGLSFIRYKEAILVANNDDRLISEQRRRKSAVGLCKTFGMLVLCWGILFACSEGAVLAFDAVTMKLLE